MAKALGRTGSVELGIVSPDLLDERAKCNFDKGLMQNFLLGTERNILWKQAMDDFGSDPELRNTLKFYDMTREEMMIDLWRRMNEVYKKHG